MRLYGLTDTKWKDPWGDMHRVDMLVSVVEVVQAGMFPYDNGYTVEMNRVFVDDTGATYLEVPPIDFGGSTYYIKRPTSMTRLRWRSRLPRRVVGLDHRPITERKP